MSKADYEFERGHIPLPDPDTWLKEQRKLWPQYTDRQHMAGYERLSKDVIWMNDRYQVNVDEDPEHGFRGMDLWHLSIKRRDRKPIEHNRWRILQRIKNAICGPDIEAIELYPAESRLVDTANQYHLFAFMGGETVPCGWFMRHVDDRSRGGAVQRPGADNG